MRSRADAKPNGNPYHDGKGSKQHQNSHHGGKPGTIAFLRWMMVFLSIACFFQVSHHQHRRIFGNGVGYTGATVLYVNDGQSLQKVNPDAPLVSYGVRGRSGSGSGNSSPKPLPPIPRFEVDSLYRVEQDRIDHGMDDEARCAQYGVPVMPSTARKRRVFYGSMLANENPEVLVAHALEAYNLYDVVALVESNTTHGATPRQMRYGPDSFGARTLTESELFGFRNTTRVVIDYWLKDELHLTEMDREVEQRNTIWKIWLDEGMAPWDVGIMADLDEVASRDFLVALKACDFPKLHYDPETRPTCQTPKMALSTMQFESSPLCVKNQEWFHPDLIPGNCVLGVGDPTGRAVPERNRWLTGDRKIPAGRRRGHWGSNDYNKYPKDVIENNRFPLWDGRDVREVNGNFDSLVNYVGDYKAGMGDTAVYGTAYHLHNWFRDLTVLRHKYATYGHATENAEQKPLSKIQGDLDMLVRCVRKLGNDPPPEVGTKPHDGYPYHLQNNLVLPGAKQPDAIANHKNTHGNTMFTLGGNRPIFFQNRTYVEQRHALITQLILDDEKQHGSFYREQGAVEAQPDATNNE